VETAKPGNSGSELSTVTVTSPSGTLTAKVPSDWVSVRSERREDSTSMVIMGTGASAMSSGPASSGSSGSNSPSALASM
jgi:hypothetical protein